MMYPTRILVPDVLALACTATARMEGLTTYRTLLNLLIGSALIAGCNAQEEPTALPDGTGPQLIVNGAPTGDAYPNVGAIMFDFQGDGIQWYDVVCSGSLIERTVFLTAAHCVAWAPPNAQLYVTFDPDLQVGGVSGLIAGPRSTSIRPSAATLAIFMIWAC